MMISSSTLYFLLFILITVQSAIIQDINPCLSKLTCRECIQTRGCAFCTEKNFGDRPRCFKPELHLSDESKKCPENSTVNPNNYFNFTINESLTSKSWATGGGGGGYISGGSYESNKFSSSSSASGKYDASYGSSYGMSSASSHGNVVQVRPQKVDLKLRINQEARFTIQYAQAVDYPVDLYYLMDLSKSMEDDKEKLSKLGDLLSETMRNITSNFKLGFGSFVDKVLMPYVSTVPKKLLHPCEGCEAPYGFRNHMPLNTDTRTFSEEVKKAAVSGNLDAPEGGFDAIMQAIVCGDIGWREQARHLLVFSTDAGFHYAGDGKLGGVITPNDGQCHLDHRGYYTHSTLQDYPSISQISQKVKNNSVNIIFAVTKQQIEIYNKLVEHIEGSSSAVLSSDSSNVVDIVREEYKKISSSVEMKTNIASEHIKASFYSSCLSGGPQIATNKCDGLKVGDIVNFTVEIIATSCEQNQTHEFKIYPVGLTDGTLIKVELICDCECEHPTHPSYVRNAAECSFQGALKCGICECNKDHFGEKCQCSIDNPDAIDDNNRCRPENTTLECSGRGNCICGRCECTKRTDPSEIISGKYCECDNFSCERKENNICSGNGNCICGRCDCFNGWSGSDCSCKVSNSDCINPIGQELCSGHGQCHCGKCICDATDQFRYSGKYCEKCPTCPQRCHDFRECVQCKVHNTGILKDKCEQSCNYTIEEVEKLEYDENKEENLCSFYDEDDCKYQFVYFENRTDDTTTSSPDTKIHILALKHRDCPPKVFMLGIVLGVIAAIVLIGLAVLLLWKLLTTIHDRREFARFEKERMMAKWDTGENPIYKQATSTFKNPTYGK